MIDVVRDRSWRGAPTDEAITQAVATTLCACDVAPEGSELCVRLSDNDTVRKLNAAWRACDAVTDVLAFPQQEGRIDPALPLGDIILAVPFVQREAQQLQLDETAHAIHLIIHGTLHLLGFDHAEAENCRTMRALENRIMTQLSLHTPWPEEATE